LAQALEASERSPQVLAMCLARTRLSRRGSRSSPAIPSSSRELANRRAFNRFSRLKVARVQNQES